MDENEKRDTIEVSLPANVINTSPDDITVEAPLDNGGSISFHKPRTPPEIILDRIARDLGITPTPSERAKFIESVEQVEKTYVEELEVKLGLLGVRIKRSPKMVIKRYGE